ncbi:MAG: indolepyruvate ferredoxin oxidoreductase subunit beta [Archaeoglobaceae archaeon]
MKGDNGECELKFNKLNKFNVLLVGIGGQGIITSAMILGEAALNADINVLGAETHGMAQRGGSVEVHIRMGKVYAPLIPVGGADTVVALEPVEALRFSRYAREGTKVILNTRSTVPLSVSMEGLEYPSIEEITEMLEDLGCEVHSFDATGIAERVAKAQATNVVMLGALSRSVELPFDINGLEEGLKNVLPQKLHQMNIKALRSGYEAV